MNNTGKKILILGIAIAITIAGILAFYPTIVAPPTDVPVENLHKTSLEANINEFSDIKNTNFNDSIYNVVIDKLVMYKREGFMTVEEIDYQKKALVQKYLPIFIKLSDAKFDESNWRESDHKAILERISHLRTLKVYGGTTAATGSYESDLRRIEEIISDYNRAKIVASYSTFYTVDDANSHIQDAERYRTMAPLSNCTDLTNKLSVVKSNIGDSHYSQVESILNEMVNYCNMTEDSFNKLTSTVYNKILEYDNNRSKYGYNAKTTEDLKQKAAEYYRNAKEFYTRKESNINTKDQIKLEYDNDRSKYGYNAKTTEDLKQKAAEYYRNANEFYTHKEININTNDQWMSMSSPNIYCRAYQSSSNYHVNNSEATMTFTIKGYDKFIFYIRSDGEVGIDYVMVGVNAYPTKNSNYSNTEDKASSGTSLLCYKSVILNNLDVSSTYTIYVVYHKNDEGHFGADRGYVLIPYKYCKYNEN